MSTEPSGSFLGCRVCPTGRYTAILLAWEVHKIEEIGSKQFGHVFSICCFATAICHQFLVAKYAVSACFQTCFSRQTPRIHRSFCTRPGMKANMGSGAWLGHHGLKRLRAGHLESDLNLLGMIGNPDYSMFSIKQ